MITKLGGHPSLKVAIFFSLLYLFFWQSHTSVSIVFYSTLIPPISSVSVYWGITFNPIIHQSLILVPTHILQLYSAEHLPTLLTA